MKQNLIILLSFLLLSSIFSDVYIIYSEKLISNIIHYERAFTRLNLDICTNMELRMITDADLFCLEADGMIHINPYIKTVFDCAKEFHTLLIPENIFDYKYYIKAILFMYVLYNLQLFKKNDSSLPLSVINKIKNI